MKTMLVDLIKNLIDALLRKIRRFCVRLSFAFIKQFFSCFFLGFIRIEKIIDPIEKIIDANNLVYLYDPAKGFYIFGYYGTFKNNLPFLHWENISVSSTGLTGFLGKQYYSYQLQSMALKTYTLPVFLKDYSSIRAMNGKIYLLKKEGVEIYSVL